MSERRQKLLENLIYAAIWIIVLLVPMIILAGQESYRWEITFKIWLGLIPFMLLYIINNYILIPRLLLGKYYGYYFLSAFVLIALIFSVEPLITGKHHPPHMPPELREKIEMQGRQRAESENSPQDWEAQQALEEQSFELSDTMAAGVQSTPKKIGPPPMGRFMGKPIPFKWGRMLNDWLLAFMIVGLNIGICMLFRSIHDARRMKELESQNLKAELNYLKSQINPHFFMNTLNNIHALIDIETEKAKETVIELSKIMRYVLYDADQPTVALEREVLFMQNYVRLMRIRYPDAVEITADHPEFIPEVRVPPLMFMTLLENAFKHGISYRQNSYIKTSMKVSDDRIIYEVRNSIPSDLKPGSGIGLENLRKRLNLIFGNNYCLSATADGDEFSAILEIPVL